MPRSGHTVVIHYNNNHDAATALADEITNDGGQVATISADLAAEDGPDMFWSRYDAALEALSLPPRADILVNNAGINCRGTIDTLTVPQFRRTGQREPACTLLHHPPRARPHELRRTHREYLLRIRPLRAA
ncbi:SDR family NAD(P)-dependent oxidoreductase [Rhodococcus pyridinivorans]|uniref:SDR family NAD(P)-dependent oxidoreductase n=1 Tax=Rhodococcus pyridinivorans TaxID=103816 RepID=UPI002AD1F002|nr:SDR family NAD(P)-dependent oxidoreductase [Rhodococcus pyridinivorans]